MSQIANPAIQGTWSMSEIRSGNLLIRTRADKIAFEIIGNTTQRSIIDSSELPALLEFLNSYLQSRSNRRTGFRINLSQLKQDISSRFRVFVESDGRKVAVTPILGTRVTASVNQNIRNSLTRLQGAHAGCWKHLALAIKTGASCSYTPEKSIRWVF